LAKKGGWKAVRRNPYFSSVYEKNTTFTPFRRSIHAKCRDWVALPGFGPTLRDFSQTQGKKVEKVVKVVTPRKFDAFHAVTQTAYIPPFRWKHHLWRDPSQRDFSEMRGKKAVKVVKVVLAGKFHTLHGVMRTSHTPPSFCLHHL